MNNICDPQPTELTGFDSAGVIVGHAEYGVFKTPDDPMSERMRWRISVGKAVEFYCHREQVERWLRDNGAVEIKEGDVRR